MKGCRKALGVSLAAVAALLSSSGIAWTQETGRPPGAPMAGAAPALSKHELDARVVARMDELPPVQLGTAWEGVVNATFEGIEQLPQAAGPAMTSDAPRRPTPDLLEVPRPDVMTSQVDPAEQAPEAGPTFKLGPFQFTLTPVVAESPVVANVRGPQAILLGVTFRIPGLVP